MRFKIFNFGICIFIFACQIYGEADTKFLTRGAKEDFANLYRPQESIHECQTESCHYYGNHLFYYVRKEDLEMVDYIINTLGVDVNLIDSAGRSALDYSILVGNEKLVEFLLDKGATIKKPQNWFDAIYREDLPSFKHLIEKSTNINKIARNWTPILISVYYNKIEFVKYLIEKDASVTISNEEGLTPFHLAVKYAHLNISQYLLNVSKSIINVQDNLGKTPLLHAIENNLWEITKFLLDNGASPYISDLENNSVLHYAVKSFNVIAVRFLINYKPIRLLVNSRETKNYDTPLTLLTKRFSNNCSKQNFENFKEIFETLGSYGANINANSINATSGENCLYLATSADCLEAVKYIHQHGGYHNITDLQGNTPLHIATLNGFLDIVKYFVNELNTPIDNRGQKRQTPLHLSSLMGHYEISSFLLKSGANIHAKDLNDKTPLELASSINQRELFLLFLQEEMVFAINNGNYSKINWCIDHGADLNRKDSKELLPIYYAIAKYDFDLVNFLIEKGSSTEIPNKDNLYPFQLCKFNTPLYQFLVNKELFDGIRNKSFSRVKRAVILGADLNYKEAQSNFSSIHLVILARNLEILEFLINEGADVFSKIKNSLFTPFHLASSMGYLDVIQVLLKNHADFNSITSTGIKPIHLAAQNGHADVIQFLINPPLNVSINEIDFEGNTIVHYGAEIGNEFLFNFFEKIGANLTAKNYLENSAFHKAAFFGNIKIVKYLHKKIGLDINELGWNKWTPLHFVCQGHGVGLGKFQEATVKYLLSQSANIQAKNNVGALPIHIAAKFGQISIVNLLLPGNVNKTDYFGFTLLHYAAKSGNVNLIRLLLDNGANLYAAANNSNKAVHIAAENGHKEIIEFLHNNYSIDLSEKGERGWTLAHFAAKGFSYINETNLIQVLKYLSSINQNLIFAKEPYYQRFPIHIGAIFGNAETVQYLLSIQNMSINTLDSHGWTPFHLACSEGNLNIVELLLKNGANTSIESVEGFSGFSLAVKNRQRLLLTYFLKNKLVDPSKKESHGWSLLFHATRSGDLSLVKYIVKYGNASILVRDKQQRLPVHYAALFGYKNIIEYFTKNNHEIVNDTDINLWTPLHFASVSTSSEGDRYFTVKYLVDEAKSNVQAEDKEFGRIPLHWAAIHNNLDVVKFFLENKKLDISPNRVDNLSSTPLLLATENRNFAVIQYLVEKGSASINAINDNGEDAIEIANKMGFSEIEIYLKEKYKIIERDFGKRRLVRDLGSYNIPVSSSAFSNKNNFFPLYFANKIWQIGTILSNFAMGFSENSAKLPNIKTQNKFLSGGESTFFSYKKNLRKKRAACASCNCVFEMEKNKIPDNEGENEKIKNQQNNNENMIREFTKFVDKINTEAFIKYIENVSPNEKEKLLKIAEGSVGKLNGNFKAQVEDLIKLWQVDVHNEKLKRISEASKKGGLVNRIYDYSAGVMKRNIFDKVALSPAILKNQIKNLGRNIFYPQLSKQPKINKIKKNKVEKLTKGVGNLNKAILAKNLLSSALRGDAKGVGLTAGIIIGDKVVEKIAHKLGDYMGKKGTKLINRAKFANALGKSKFWTKAGGKLLRGMSKIIGPIAGSLTSGFTIASLVSNVKEFQNGTKDAVADIVADVVSLVADIAIIITQIAMAVGAVTGPVGGVIVLVAIIIDLLVSLAVGIFKAIRAVEKIDKVIKLSDIEKLEQGLRAFLGGNIPNYLDKLMKEKNMNNQMAKDMLDFLANETNTEYQRYVTSSQTLVYYDCKIKWPWYCLWGFFCPGEEEDHEKCKTNWEENRHSKVFFNKKQDIYLERSYPDPPERGEILCSPGREKYKYKYSNKYSEYAYFCEGAIGVKLAYTTGKKDQALFDLKDGIDTAIGFEHISNVFMVDNGVKEFTGGYSNDSFTIRSGRDRLNGILNGGPGIDTLVIEDITAPNLALEFDLNLGRMISLGESYINMSIKNFEQIIGRNKKRDVVKANCEASLLNMQGGSDEISIACSSSDKSMQTILHEYDSLVNKAIRGNFTYIFSDPNSVSLDLIASGENCNHIILFKNSARKFSNVEFISQNLYFSSAKGNSEVKLNYENMHSNIEIADKYYAQPQIITMLTEEEEEAVIKVEIVTKEIVLIHQIKSNNHRIRYGVDFAKNLFLLENSAEIHVYGGIKNDIFILKNSLFSGLINGGGGQNILIVEESYCQNFNHITANFYANEFLVNIIFKKISIFDIHVFLGCEAKKEIIFPNCKIELIDGKGGRFNAWDEITFKEGLNCLESNNIVVQVSDFTMVKNYASKGQFTYLIPENAYNQEIEVESYSKNLIIFTFSIHVFSKIELTFSENVKFLSFTVKQSGKIWIYKIHNFHGENSNPNFFTSLDPNGADTETQIKINEDKSISIIHPLGKNDGLTMRKGFLLLQNTFTISSGNWVIESSGESDIFIIEGIFQGSITGKYGKSHSLFISNKFDAQNSNLIIDLSREILDRIWNLAQERIPIKGLEMLVARENKGETIISSCHTSFINGQNGESPQKLDKIKIPEKDCFYNIYLFVNNFTSVENWAKNGTFNYEIATTGLFEFNTNFRPGTNHNFLFSFTSKDLDSIVYKQGKISFTTFFNFYGFYKLKPVEIGEELHSQPKFLTKDKVLIQASPKGVIYSIFNTENLELYDNSTDSFKLEGLEFTNNIFNIHGSESGAFIKIFSNGRTLNIYRLFGQFPINGTILTGNRNETGSIILESDFVPDSNVSVNMTSKEIFYGNSKRNLDIVGKIHSVSGRVNKSEIIVPGCETNAVDGRGGSDFIHILENNCKYTLRIEVYEDTTVQNEATEGIFNYIIHIPRVFDLIFFQKEETEEDILIKKFFEENDENLLEDYDINEDEEENKLDENIVDEEGESEILDENTGVGIGYNFIEEEFVEKILTHNLNLNIELKDIESILFIEKEPRLNITTKNDQGVFSFLIKKLEDGETFYSQPRILTEDSGEIKISDIGEIYITLVLKNRQVSEIISTFPSIANKLNSSFFIFIENGIEKEWIQIGNNGRLNMLNNDQSAVSHLFGNGGENILTIYPPEDNKNIFIYALPNNLLNTLDLSQIVIPIRENYKNKFVPKLKKYQDEYDIYMDFDSFKIIFKNGVEWFKNMHIILESSPMQIHFNGLPSKKEFRKKRELFETHNFWSIEPLPITLNEKEVILLDEADLEIGSEIMISESNTISRFSYGKNPDNGHLIVSNTLSGNRKIGDKILSLIITGLEAESFEKLSNEDDHIFINLSDQKLDLVEIIAKDKNGDEPLQNFTKGVEDFRSKVEQWVFKESFQLKPYIESGAKMFPTINGPILSHFAVGSHTPSDLVFVDSFRPRITPGFDALARMENSGNGNYFDEFPGHFMKEYN